MRLIIEVKNPTEELIRHILLIKNKAHRIRCAPFLSFKPSKHFFNGFYYVFYGKTEFFK